MKNLVGVICLLIPTGSCSTHRGENVNLAASHMSVVAFGDWGDLTEELALSMNRFHEVFVPRSDAVFLLGDNFYPHGIDSKLGVRDPKFRLFRDIVARDAVCPFYVILGNHDRDGNVDAQVAYSAVHPKWNMPAFYYFQSFTLETGARICTWFLDTTLAGEAQAHWFNSSISHHKASCRWLLVSGHHPVFTAGEYHSSKRMQEWILSILEEHDVDIYMSGHEHQSQVLQKPGRHTTYLVSGAVADMRHKPLHKHKFLKFGDQKSPALLSLVITDEFIGYTFHNTAKSVAHEPMFHHMIRK